MGLRVDQRLVDPVGHLLGPTQAAVVAGEEDAGRTIRWGVEELILLSPGDSAAVLGHPRVNELIGQRRQRPRARDTDESVGTLQGQGQPRHVVVVTVGPPAVVACEVTADLPSDRLDPLGLRIAHLGVDEGVQQVGLPPVVPGAEGRVLAGGRPAHHTELGGRQLPESPEMAFGNSSLGTARPVHPLLIHGS